MVMGSFKSYGRDTQSKIKHTTWLTSSINKEYSLLNMMVCDICVSVIWSVYWVVFDPVDLRYFNKNELSSQGT